MGITIGERKRAFKERRKGDEKSMILNSKKGQEGQGLSYIDSRQLSSALSFHPFSKDI